MADDYDFDEDEFDDEDESSGEGGDDELSGLDAAQGDPNSLGISIQGIRDWLTAKRGWILIIGLSLAQAAFATILIYFRSEAKPVSELRQQAIRDLAVEMLGHEVKIDQIYQLVPMRGGRRMTVGLDLVLVLGQLPVERVEGSLRPTSEEIDTFIEVIQSMEPAIRSRVNMLLQQIPPEELGDIEAQKALKGDIMRYVNDTLDSLDYGKGLRKGIGKRRVTDVLVPMFVRQQI